MPVLDRPLGDRAGRDRLGLVDGDDEEARPRLRHEMRRVDQHRAEPIALAGRSAAQIVAKSLPPCEVSAP